MIKSKKNNTLKIKRGDTFVHRFSLFIESAEGQAPLNLSDVARIDLQAMSDDEIVLSLSTKDRTLILQDNSLIMLVSKKLTEGKEWETADYDVQVTFNDNVTKTIFSGKIKLEPDVTGSKVAENETSFERAIEFAMQNEVTDIVVTKESVNLIFGIAVKGDDGQDGATFTPHLNGTVLSFTNDKGLPNPDPVDLKGAKGDQGNDGNDGQNGVTFTPSIVGTTLHFTNNGGLSNPQPVDLKGVKGDTGLSAYQIWLANGNSGNESDFLQAIKGVKGDNGDDGNDGVNGKSAYDLWLAEGNQGSITDFLNSLKGNDGTDGNNGDDGKSAYQLAQDQGYQGSLEDWLNDRVTAEALNKAITPINTEVNNVKNSIGNLTLVNLLDNTAQEVTSLNEYILYRKSPELKALMLGGTFTLSFDIKVAVSGNVSIYSSNDSGISYSASVNVPEPSTWFRRSVVIRPIAHKTTPDNANGTIEFYGTYNTGRIPTVRNVKLEYGTVATGYTISPNDLIQPLRDQLTDIDDRLKSLEKRFNTPDKAIGKNYILNSKYFNEFRNNNSVVYTLLSGKDSKGQWISGTSKGVYSISTYSEFLRNGAYFSEDLTQELVTVSAYFNPTHACSIRLDNSSVVRLQPNQWTRVSVTHRSERMAGIYVEQVDAVVNDEQPFRLYHERWKLEKGSRVTDWIE